MIRPVLTTALALSSFGIGSVAAQGNPVVPEVPGVVQEVLKTAAGGEGDACTLACASIASLLPSRVHLSNADRSFVLWDTKQDELSPTCRVTPSSAEDVSIAVKTLVGQGCHFAVKSGGMARIAGASNIHGGVVIDLAPELNGVVVSEDKKSVVLGSGATWGQVYKKLEEDEITVIGGRVSSVGVGGLLLGGGVSFITERHGWGCDNVLEYELVLSDGTIKNVTYESDPDLFWALRGGGTNFGIVTRFTVNAFPIPGNKLFGGSRVFTQDKFDEILEIYGRTVAEKSASDLDADTWISFSYFAEYKSLVGSWQMMHSIPEMNPPIYKEALAVPFIMDSLRVANLTSFTDEIATFTPMGMRQLYRAVAFKADPKINKMILDIYLEEIEPLKELVGTVPAVILQPISRNAIKHMDKNGGNALGLFGIEQDLTLFSISFSYLLASDDALVSSVATKFFDRATRAIRKNGELHRFVYSNYAHEDQDPFRGYGVKNFERLEKIAKRVDPEGVFARGGLCDGPFRVQVREGKHERVRDEL